MTTTTRIQPVMPMLAAHDQRRAAAAEPFQRLWRMTSRERIAASYRGDL